MYCKFSARVQNVIQIFAVQIKLINIVSEKKNRVLIFACVPSSVCFRYLRVHYTCKIAKPKLCQTVRDENFYRVDRLREIAQKR